MPITYLYGYPKNGVETRVTREQLDTKWTWRMLHPELQRRLLAMMHAAMVAGFDCGIGEGARSTNSQTSTFLARHVAVPSGGCCSYKNQRFALKAGMAHAAPPGSSVHEDELYDGYALAVDMRGWENHWFDNNCSRFGLKNFGGKVGPNVNNEEWHFQPIEFGNSRSTIVAQIAQGVRLMRFPLPGEGFPPPVIEPPVIVNPPPPPVEETEPMIVLIVTDVRAPYARWKSNGVVKSWITGHFAAQVDMRLAECANGTKPSPVDGFTYKELKHGDNEVIASYGPVVGPHPGAQYDEYGRLLSS